MTPRPVLEVRPCACGCSLSFAVTSRNKDQRYATRNCVNDLRSRYMAALRVKTTKALRQSKFGAEVTAAVGGVVTESRLLEMCARAYEKGYQAGYQRFLNRARRQVANGRAVGEGAGR